MLARWAAAPSPEPVGSAQAAPDNFWTLLGELVSLGGWALLRVVLVVLPLRTIYIVPKLSMNGRIKAYVYPNNTESAELLERYRENWDLL